LNQSIEHLIYCWDVRSSTGILSTTAYVQDPAVGIYTYFTDENTNFSQDPNQWRWELEGMVMNKIPKWTIDHVDYYGHNMSVSQIIPMNVYNQTAYSVVAETCWQDNFAFFTEKTAKPIMAQTIVCYVCWCQVTWLTYGS
jgi:hypothetical protein